jgi:RNA polymerase sigma factor (sigma-70 family)
VEATPREDMPMSAPPLNRLLNHLRRAARPSDPASDRDLLAAYAGGDQAAFAELVRRHGAMVRGVGRRILGDAHAAEDVGQATFLVLARKAPGRAWDESVGGWLHGVAYRLALKARASIRRPIPAAEARRPPTEPAAEMESRELRTLLDAELRDLPARYRGPLVLCYLEGRTRDEAARQLGVTVAAVKGRLERGRDLLRDRLTRRGCCLGVGLTAAALADDAVAAPAVDRWTAVATGADVVPAGVERLAAGIALTGHAGRWALVAGLFGLAAATAGVAFGVGDDQKQPSHPAPVVREAIVRTDGFGDPLPDGAKARLGTVRWRTGGGVRRVAPSPDGKVVVAATSRGVQFWDAATGRPIDHTALRNALVTAGSPRTVALSPDGSILATSRFDNPRPVSTVRLWEVAPGRELPFPMQDIRASELVFSPDGKTLAGRRDIDARIPNRPDDGDLAMLWEMPSGKVIGRLNHVKDGDPPGMNRRLDVGWMAYAPDSRTLYTASRKPALVFVWDTATGRLTRTIPLPKDAPNTGLALSPDGSRIAAFVGGRISIVDVASGQETKTIDTDGRKYLSLVYADHGNSIAGRSDRAVDFYDTMSGERRFSAPAGGALQHEMLCAAPNGLRVYFSDGNCVRVWDVKTGRELNDAKEFVAGINSLAAAGEGRTLLAAAVATNDRRIRCWDINSFKELPELRYLKSPRSASLIAFSPDGRFAAWAVSAARESRAGDGGDQKSVPQPATSAHIAITETATGKSICTIEDPASRPLPFPWSPDGKLVAGNTAESSVQIWEAATGKPVRNLAIRLPQNPGAGFPQQFMFGPDGRTLAASYNSPRDLVFWDVTTGDIRQKIPLLEGRPTDATAQVLNSPRCMAFAPDGRTIAIGVNAGIRRWDLTTGKELPVLDRPPGGVAKCLFSSDGKLVIAGSFDGSVWAWDAANGQINRKYAGHSHEVTSMVLTPDGKTLVTGSADTTILIWDITGW